MSNVWDIHAADELYGVSKWSDGFFSISQKGHLQINPQGDDSKLPIDLVEIINEIKSDKIQFPVVIRFHDILRSKVKVLNETFKEVIRESSYNGEFKGVYPIKVNQMREVVEEIVEAGKPYDFGLEAGSKAELLTVLAYNTNANVLTILNGYKDKDYLKLALMGNRMGRKMIVVIEKFSEIKDLLDLSDEMGVRPIIGLRAKMAIQGKGRWSSSSGERAKFGLNASELLNAIEYIKERGYIESLELFHFHIGSQITDIRSIKEAINEGGRIFAQLVKYGAPLKYFDAGGGLGVDYDGTMSVGDSSKNYGLKEYVSDVVYGLKQICDLEEVAHPDIVTESGRALTAHHSCVITNVIGTIERNVTEFNTEYQEGEHILVTNMRELEIDLDRTSIKEVYNDAAQIKGDTINGFKLGVLTLRERAVIETIYWRLMEKVFKMASSEDLHPSDIEHLEQQLSGQYLCNFSVFQSAADTWAIDQILPIMPIERLNERPNRECTIGDITCDSDGKIDKFLYKDGASKTISVHKVDRDKPYYLGMFLTGAYQDVMGDNHNLFGRLNEVHVYSCAEEPGNYYIEETIKGNSAEQVLSTMQYNTAYMAHIVKRCIDEQTAQGKIAYREGVKLVDFYESSLASYTYLNLD